MSPLLSFQLKEILKELTFSRIIRSFTGEKHASSRNKKNGGYRAHKGRVRGEGKNVLNGECQVPGKEMSTTPKEKVRGDVVFRLSNVCAAPFKKGGGWWWVCPGHGRVRPLRDSKIIALAGRDREGTVRVARGSGAAFSTLLFMLHLSREGWVVRRLKLFAVLPPPPFPRA